MVTGVAPGGYPARPTSARPSAAADPTDRPNEPELIQAIGGVFGVILAGWQALTSRKVRDLEAQLAIVVGQRGNYRRPTATEQP
ncbi:Uncharacterised protein [Mycobacteroides abscessus]|nr:Uncharacterised protein [Mycobacteroides abscessus]